MKSCKIICLAQSLQLCQQGRPNLLQRALQVDHIKHLTPQCMQIRAAWVAHQTQSVKGVDINVNYQPSSASIAAPKGMSHLGRLEQSNGVDMYQLKLQFPRLCPLHLEDGICYLTAMNLFLRTRVHLVLHLALRLHKYHLDHHSTMCRHLRWSQHRLRLSCGPIIKYRSITRWE